LLQEAATEASALDSPATDVVSNASAMVDTKMTKTVGEHWVCATLARHDWAPALTRDGIARTDILAVGTLLPNRPTVEIQVKTASARGEPVMGAWGHHPAHCGAEATPRLAAIAEAGDPDPDDG